MSVTSGFFNSLSGDRKYDAIQISSMFDGLITDGIYNGFLESFMVTASSPASMVVTVGEGRCWFNHTWTLNDAPLPLTLDVGDVVLNRIDTIVIDVDSTDTVRACTIKVVKGTPSSQAVRPTLENTETHHQYPLCDISVPAGATTVTQSNITNRRGTSDCPFVATLMTTVTVDELLVQWESQWNDWMTDRANAMDSWTAEQQEAFTTWFQTVQDILDEDTAGNLLNLIQQEIVDRKAVDSELKSGKFNATAERSGTTVSITAPDGVETLVFVAPADWTAGDSYTVNGQSVTITDLNGEPVEDGWKQGSPVQLFIQGTKAFFKTGGGAGVNETLPAQVTNFKAVQASGAKSVTVSWTKPSSYFSGILIVRKTGSAPTGVKDGTKVYDGTGTSFVDSSVDYNTTYYYRAFPYNSKGQYQTEYLVVNITPKLGVKVNSMRNGVLVRAGTFLGEPVVWRISDKNHSGYPANSVTLMTDKIIALLSADAEEPNNNNSTRRMFGNNRHIYSNVLQWLNSSAAPNTWYTAKHSADAPPTSKNVLGGYNPYSDWAGFLEMLGDDDFVAALMTTTLTVGKTEDDGGGLETFTAKMFLASAAEIGVANENGISEGSKLAIFSDDESRLAYCTQSAYDESDFNTTSPAEPLHWWLRTPDYLDPANVRVAPSLRYPYDSDTSHEGIVGVRPLCNISGDTLVSPTPNADGSYNIVW